MIWLQQLPVSVQTAGLLLASNVFMTLRWAVFYLDQPLKWDYLWAGLCMVGAAYFMFRGG